MSVDELKRIASDAVQDYIFKHTHEDEKKLVLRHKLILGLPASMIAQQIALRKKAETKVPHFHQTRGVIYSPTLNFEQSSSEATARFKAKLVLAEIRAEKPKIADLTGGFGVDCFFFSEHANAVDYIEPSAELGQIAHHNFQILKKNIRTHLQTAEVFLEENPNRFDLIYLDPSRRDLKAKKIFALSDCSPNVCQLLPRLLGQTDFVLLKASPLLDIKQALRELAAVRKVVVVSVDNECKELLFLIEKNFEEEPNVQTFNLDRNGKIKHSFNFYLSEEETTTSEFATPQKYLYEPNASILKAGAFKKVGQTLGLKKIQVNTHLYTSDRLVEDFPGRIFEIEELEVVSKSLTGKYVNIISRNYPMSPHDLKKKLKTKDGGEKYAIAFSGLNKKYLITAKRLA